MVRLAGARIENYKGIKKLALDLSKSDGSVFPIIGLNESGKTTILEALTFVPTTLQDLSALEIVGLRKQEPHQLIPIGERTSFTGKISVALQFEFADKDIEEIKAEFRKSSGYELTHVPKLITLRKEIVFDNAEKKSEELYYSIDERYAKVKSRQAKPDSGTLWPLLRNCIRNKLPVILYIPNFLFELPGSIPLVPINDLVRPRDAFFHRLLDGLLKRSDSSLSFHGSLVDRASRATPQMTQAYNATVTRLEYALNQHVLQHWESIGGKNLQGLYMTLETEIIDEVPSLVMSLKQTGQQYKIEDRSLGFRWFFAFLMLTFYASGHDRHRQTVFLLDEPASNLHAAAQTKLLNSLQSLQGSLFIYSTHSHYLLSADLLPNTFVARNLGYDPSKDDEYVAQETDIRAIQFRQFVSEYPDQTEHFKVAMDILDVPVSSLELGYPCVFVEGKSDWYYLKLAEMAGVAKGLKVYPFGGVNTIDLRINDAVIHGSNFVLLVDGDTSIASKLATRYGKIVEDSTVDLATILGEGAQSEDLFSTEIQAKIIETAGLTGSSKAKLQRSAEICVASKKPVSFDAKTKANFTALIKRLNEIISKK